jgi:hypothetical protein
LSGAVIDLDEILICFSAQAEAVRGSYLIYVWCLTGVANCFGSIFALSGGTGAGFAACLSRSIREEVYSPSAAFVWCCHRSR